MLRRPFLAAAGALLLPAGGLGAAAGPGPAGRSASASTGRWPIPASRPACSERSAATPASPSSSSPGPALAVLDAVTHGEVDAALLNAPEAESRIAEQSLVHDRRLIARGEFVLVGPGAAHAAAAPPRPGSSGAEALLRIRDLAAARRTPATLPQRRRGLGRPRRRAGALARGAGRAAAALVRHRRSAAAASSPRSASAAPTRWSSAAPGRPWAARRSPSSSKATRSLAEPVHAMRSFRVSHPAGKIFLGWIGGGRGRAVVASMRGLPGAGGMTAARDQAGSADVALSGRLRSLNVARAAAVSINGRRVMTAIGKRPVEGPRAVLPLGIEGDEQADLSVHGGPGKAVYLYPSEHYGFWQTVRAQAGVGALGRAAAARLARREPDLEGVLESGLWIGDVLRFPNCALAVSEPRFPCFKFNAAMGFKHAGKLMAQSAWCGAYLAVREPGTIEAGQTFTLMPGPREVGIVELFRARTGRA